MSDIAKLFDDSPALRWNQTKPWDRHGLVLMTAGFAYILIGTALVSSEDTQLNEGSFRQAIHIIPYTWWCVGFIVVGVISIISSRWPSKPRTLGYAALTGWTSACAGLYIFGGLSDNNSSSVVMGFVWAMMGFLWWAISGLICPPNERGSRGVPSPHRDYSSGFDRYAYGDGHPAVSYESESNRSP